MADNNTVARPYAQALFELANEAGELAAWSKSLETASQLLADGRVVDYLGNPAFNDKQRLEFLTGLFAKAGARMLAGKNRQGANFLRLLLEYGRVSVFPEIAVHFETLKAKVENTVDVTVTSACEISKKHKDAISKALRKRLGRDVRLETKIDKNLIGGAVIRAGDVVIDGSLRTRLEGLSNALIK